MADNNNQIIAADVAGYDVVTNAIMDLINTFPLLQEDEAITFAVLSATGGKALFPLDGAGIEREVKDILGGTEQWCAYPFLVIYRSGSLTEARRKRVKEWLDDLGRWFEGQSVNGSVITYPLLTDKRRFTEIVRTSPAHMYSISDAGVEDWAISITARYTNTFKKEELRYG